MFTCKQDVIQIFCVRALIWAAWHIFRTVATSHSVDNDEMHNQDNFLIVLTGVCLLIQLLAVTKAFYCYFAKLFLCAFFSTFCFRCKPNDVMYRFCILKIQTSVLFCYLFISAFFYLVKFEMSRLWCVICYAWTLIVLLCIVNSIEYISEWRITR